MPWGLGRKTGKVHYDPPPRLGSEAGHVVRAAAETARPPRHFACSAEIAGFLFEHGAETHGRCAKLCGHAQVSSRPASLYAQVANQVSSLIGILGTTPYTPR